MIYRYDKQANPRLIIMKLVLGLVAVAASVTVMMAPPIVSLPVFVIAALLIFKVYKVYHNLVESFINIHDEGITGKTPSGRQVRMSYSDISDAGIATDSEGQRLIFLYNEEADQLLQIPDLYRNFQDMIDEIGGYLSLRTVELEEAQTLEDLLKQGFEVGEPEE